MKVFKNLSVFLIMFLLLIVNVSFGAPVINSVTPDNGNNFNTTSILINGQNFDASSRVYMYTKNDFELKNTDTPGEANGVFVKGNYAYVADGIAGLQIIDISFPDSTMIVGNVYTSTFVENVHVVDNYAYITDWDLGLLVIDISNPFNPVTVGNASIFWASGVFVQGNYAYVTSSNQSEGLYIVDISNPVNPFITGSVVTPDYAKWVHVSGNYAYIADMASGLQIADISNPYNPFLVGSVDTPGAAYCVSVSTTIYGNYAFVSDETYGLQIIQVTVPSSPWLIGSIDTPGKAYGSFISDNLIYLADYEGGLKTIDITNPYTPVIINTIDTPGNACGVFINDQNIYIADESAGIHIVKKNINISNSADLFADGTDIAVSGKYAYVVAYERGIDIYDISNPNNLVYVNNIDTPGSSYNIDVSGNYAYVADGLGVQIIDISDPVTGGIVSNINTGGWPNDVFISGNYAYIADTNWGLVIADISDPLSPTIVGSNSDSSILYSVYVYGNYAYASNSIGMQIINISNPYNPVTVGSFPGNPNIFNIYVSGNYAYLADSIGLTIVDITDPGNPFLVNNAYINNGGFSIYVSKGLAYIGGFNSSPGAGALTILDVSNPLNPVRVHSIDSDNSLGIAVTASGDYVYYTCENKLYMVHRDSLIRPLENINVLSPNEISAVVPKGPKPGMYDVKVVNSLNEEGNIDNAYNILNALSSVPPAIISFNASKETGGTPFSVDFSICAYDYGNFYTFAWDFDGDGFYDGNTFFDTTGFCTTNYTYSSAGIYYPKVEVGNWDVVFSEVNNLMINVSPVSNQPPEITSFNASPNLGEVPLNVTLSAFVNDTDGYITKIELDFEGDGYYDTVVFFDSVLTIDHIYDSAGTYNSKIRVEDNDGATNEQTTTISVLNPLIIDSVFPDYGYNDTTTQITIYGGIFDTTCEIYLGRGDYSLEQSVDLGFAYSVSVLGNYAYVGADTSIKVIDISGDSAVVVATLNKPPYVYGVCASGNYLYYGTSNGFYVADISDPYNPVDIGFTYTSDGANTIRVAGNYAYIVNPYFGFAIVDISNPYNPQIIGGINMPGQPIDFSLSGNYAYVSSEWSGLYIIDISDPLNLNIISTVPLSGISGVAVVGNYAYLGSYVVSEIEIFDISNPYFPTYIADIPGSGDVMKIFASNKYLYAAKGYSGLQVIDINNPINPIVISTIDTPYYAFEAFESGNNIYVADGESGLQIISKNRISCEFIFYMQTMILAEVPGGTAPGLYDVIVQNSMGQEAVLDNAFTVLPANNPPVANDDSTSTNKNTAIDINVLLNDTDPDFDTLTVVYASQAGNGITTINPDQKINYNPDLNFIGPDSFYYIVDDGNGAWDSGFVNVMVNPVNNPPVADAGTDKNSYAGNVVNFDGSGSYDTDGVIVSYIWDYGDGMYDSGISVSHIYNTTGIYYAVLTVYDDLSANGSDTCQVTVNPPNTPPVANAGLNQTLSDSDNNNLENVILDGSGSYDSVGTIVSYLWQEDSTTISTAQSFLKDFSVGVHNITLTITDDGGLSDSDDVVVTVNENQPPVASIMFYRVPEVNEAIHFYAFGSSDPDGTIVSYEWDFGDGTTGNGNMVTHVYDSVSVTNMLTLKVTDNGGGF